jgi:cell division transport system ATP-binding protein
VISFKNVSRYYEDIKALRGINFTIEPGEFVSIVGQSGAGKSTLIRLLMAEEPVTRGRIHVGNWDITNINEKEIPQLRRQMGVVFQDFKLLSDKTVFENVAFALEVCGAPPQQIKELVPKVLDIVGLGNRTKQYSEQLSGGERQRVSIARALVHRPSLLLADEPTGNLDSINAREIIDLLKKINELGTTVVLVTHDRDVVNTLKRRVIALDRGMIVSDESVGRYVL